MIRQYKSLYNYKLLKSLALLAVLAVLAIPSLVHTQDPYPAKALVERAIDGDTIQIEGGERVRYIGVDTPETKHPRKKVQFMGKEAYEFNKKLVEGKTVHLKYDVQKRDKYDRLLAYVYVDGVFVNAELVRLGYAQIMTIPPNVQYADYFRKLQQQARENKLGLWSKE